MKNYYEMLQVSPNASKDIIEKAYKVLAKKYHPDLQKNLSSKNYAEQMLKDINEAYDVLSNDFLREQYDFELKKEKVKKDEKQNINNEYNLKNNANNKSAKISKNTEKEFSRFDYAKNRKKENEAKKYSDMDTIDSVLYTAKKIYHEIPRGKGLKDLDKKDFLAMGLTVIIVIMLGIILWFIPFTNSWIRELLFENPVFNWIGKLFG